MSKDNILPKQFKKSAEKSLNYPQKSIIFTISRVD